MYSKCQRCGRKLTDPESMVRGYGPECWADIVNIVREQMHPQEDEPIPGQMTIFELIGGEDDNGKECLPGMQKDVLATAGTVKERQSDADMS